MTLGRAALKGFRPTLMLVVAAREIGCLADIERLNEKEEPAAGKDIDAACIRNAFLRQRNIEMIALAALAGPVMVSEWNEEHGFVPSCSRQASVLLVNEALSSGGVGLSGALHRGKTHPVLRAGAKPVKRFGMRRGAIAFVLSKAVTRPALVIIFEQFIARRFC